MRFTCQGLSFDCSWTVCLNPECPCKETTFTFEEVDAKGRRVKGGHDFKLAVDLETGTEPAPPPRSDLIEAVVNDFMAEGRTGLFATLQENRQEQMAEERRIREYVIPRADIEEGALVPFSHIIAEDGGIFRGGRSCTFSVDHQGTTYYCEDLYCPKPACSCNKVTLVFIAKMPDPVGGDVVTNAFDATVTLAGKVSIDEIHEARMGKTRATDIVRSMLAQDPDMLHTLRERQQVVKDIATRSMLTTGAQATTPRIGRNAPCPCMSGKKYKNCCGR